MRDLNIMIDDVRFNVRVGMIFKYNSSVLLEIPKQDGGNSVIPGGRIKIGESSLDAICREMKEELGFIIDKKKVVQKRTIESFFKFNDINVHEIFFVYEYIMNDDDFSLLQKVQENQDSHKSTFSFVPFNEFEKVNLLPLEVISIIKE